MTSNSLCISQAFGVQVISARIISLSYPWIGLPMELFRARHQSAVPFICAHITRVIVYYSVYEATQLAFSEWFYGQGRPSQRELWLFAIMMLWEYYGMIYVRSSNSIRLFPRASLALFLLYHFYLFSCPSGFHLLALLVMFMFLTALMIHCVRKYEYDAYHRGIVNIDQPRAMYNSLPWPSWTVALAPDYTLFMPVTARSSSLYAHAVPPVHNDAAAPPQASQTNTAAAAAIGTGTGAGTGLRSMLSTSITAIIPGASSSSSGGGGGGSASASVSSSSSGGVRAAGSSSSSGGSTALRGETTADLLGDIELASSSSASSSSPSSPEEGGYRVGMRARGQLGGSSSLSLSSSSSSSSSVQAGTTAVAGASSILDSNHSNNNSNTGGTIAASRDAVGRLIPQLAGSRGTYTRLEHDSQHGGSSSADS